MEAEDGRSISEGGNPVPVVPEAVEKFVVMEQVDHEGGLAQVVDDAALGEREAAEELEHADGDGDDDDGEVIVRRDDGDRQFVAALAQKREDFVFCQIVAGKQHEPVDQDDDADKGGTLDGSERLEAFDEAAERVEQQAGEYGSKPCGQGFHPFA